MAVPQFLLLGADMHEDRIPDIVTLVAKIIGAGMIAITIRVMAYRYGGTVPGFIARSLMWIARWITNLAIQYDMFLRNWRIYRERNPIVMRCEERLPKSTTQKVIEYRKQMSIDDSTTSKATSES